MSHHRNSPRQKTASEDRLPLIHKILYGIGGASFQYGRGAMLQLANPVFHITMGINPVWIGTVMTLARLWDAVTDPFMGTVSDNCRSRFGRRKPFIVAGAIASGITFPIMWFVQPDWSPQFTIGFFAVTSFLFWAAFTVYSVPYESLGYELTPDFHERTRIFGVRLCVNQIATITMPWLYYLTQLEIFGGTLTGVRYVAGGVGVLLIVLGVLPGIFMIERYRHLASSQSKRTLVDAIVVPLKNGPFMIVAALVFIFSVGAITVEALGIYVNTYYVCGGDTKAGSMWHGWFGTVFAISCFIGGMSIGHVSARFGKIRTLYATLVLAIIGSILKWFLFRPESPGLQLIVAAVGGLAYVSFWAITFSMKADLCDYDEWKSGMRREGIYGAGAAYIHKTATSFTYLLTGLVLTWSGFRHELGSAQTIETLTNLRVMFSCGPIMFFIICIGILKLYPVDDDKMYQIRRDLEQRRSRV